SGGGERVAAVTRGKESRHAADGRDADAGEAVDLAVRHSPSEVIHDGPAIRHRLQLRRRWRIAGPSWITSDRECLTARSTASPASASRPSAAWRDSLPRVTAATRSPPPDWTSRVRRRRRRVMDELRLKLAIQKSGRLTEPSLDLLGRCGLKVSRGKDQLMAYGENMPLDVLFVRDDDIPDLVQEDVCDLGLVGLNVLEEKRLELAARGHPARFQQVRTLDFG